MSHPAAGVPRQRRTSRTLEVPPEMDATGWPTETPLPCMLGDPPEAASVMHTRPKDSLTVLRLSSSFWAVWSADSQHLTLRQLSGPRPGSETPRASLSSRHIAHCMLGLVVAPLFPSCSPSLRPDECKQLLCLLGLLAVVNFWAKTNHYPIRLITIQKLLGHPAFCLHRSIVAQFLGNPYLLLEVWDARKRNKAVGHTGHAQCQRKVGFKPEKVLSGVENFWYGYLHRIQILYSEGKRCQLSA